MKRLALILALLFCAAASAVADTPLCTGKDLIEAMRQEHPETYDTLRAEADAVLNSKGLFWRIEAPSGVTPSYLFGTIHLTDPRAHKLNPSVALAHGKAATVVVESTEALTVEDMAKRLFSVATLMLLPDNGTLEEVIPPADLPAVKAFYRKDEGGFEAVIKFRPYMLAMTLSYPPCEAARQGEGRKNLDAHLAKTATLNGAKLEGLETLAEQFSSMAAMPMPDQVAWLLQAIKFASEIDNITETLVRLYLAQDTGMLLAWSRYLAVENGTEKVWGSFKHILIDERNQRMAERALPYIKSGNAFIAVGALHLPGENGLVELLRKAGYKVTPVK